MYRPLKGYAVAQLVTGSIPDGEPLREMSTRNTSLGERRPGRRADVTTCMCPLSWNLGVWTSWEPQGLYKPSQGLLYLNLSHRTMGLIIAKTIVNNELASVRKYGVVTELKIRSCKLSLFALTIKHKLTFPGRDLHTTFPEHETEW